MLEEGTGALSGDVSRQERSRGQDERNAGLTNVQAARESGSVRL